MILKYKNDTANLRFAVPFLVNKNGTGNSLRHMNLSLYDLSICTTALSISPSITEPLENYTQPLIFYFTLIQ